jgi:hypothetical protein
MFLFTENLNILKYEYFILEHFKNKNNFYIQTICYLEDFSNLNNSQILESDIFQIKTIFNFF